MNAPRDNTKAIAPLLTAGLVARFWQKVDQREMAECWPWLGSLSSAGYGTIATDRRNGPLLAHRVSYALVHGELPRGVTLDHLCRNRGCVNPGHLEAVTHAENMRRGRGTKLTLRDVVAIRAATGTHRALGARYGVHHSTIGRILRGTGWV